MVLTARARHRHVGLDGLPVVALPHVADQGAVESGRDELAVLHDGSFRANFYRDGNWYELRLLLVSGFTLVLVSVLFAQNFRKLPLALVCTLPYVLLTAALGKMVWEAYGGHAKASGAIIVIGIFLLPLDKSLILRFMLALQAMVGLDLQTELRMMHARVLSPYLIHEEGGYDPLPPGAPDNPVLNELPSKVEWVHPADGACTATTRESGRPSIASSTRSRWP